MKLLRFFSIVCVLAIWSGAASAFQETQISPDTAVESGASKQSDDAKAAGAADLAATPILEDKSSQGTDINIPGIGKIGKLPKLDFGLELLYGANEKADASNAPTTPAEKVEPDDDVMIRGTVKHRF